MAIVLSSTNVARPAGTTVNDPYIVEFSNGSGREFGNGQQLIQEANSLESEDIAQRILLWQAVKGDPSLATFVAKFVGHTVTINATGNPPLRLQ